MAAKQIVQTVTADYNPAFDLPTELTTPSKNMESVILYGLPKCGKTTLLSKLENCLIIDTENGSNKISGLIKKVPENSSPVGKMRWLEDFADFLIAKGKPFDYIAIDTLSEVNDWAEWSGTDRYMHSIQGKKFNRGSFIIQNVSADELGSVVTELGVRVQAVSTVPSVKSHPIRAARVAIMEREMGHPPRMIRAPDACYLFQTRDQLFYSTVGLNRRQGSKLVATQPAQHIRRAESVF